MSFLASVRLNAINTNHESMGIHGNPEYHGVASFVTKRASPGWKWTLFGTGRCESRLPLLRERFFRMSMRFFNCTAKAAMLEFR